MPKRHITETERENSRQYLRERYHRTRNAALAALGGKCVRCGFSDERALQIDHVLGNGKKELNKGKRYLYYSMVAKVALAGGIGYQLLCANCNWIKRHERREM